MPSPCLLLRPPLAFSSSRLPVFPSPKTLHLSRAPRLRPLRLPAAARRPPSASGRSGEARLADDDGFIPIARCYEGHLARLELSGAARREQAVAAAAAADGGAAAEAHLAACSDAMAIEAFLPVADGGSAASTRVILQAKEVEDKASKIKKQLGSDFFTENEPDTESALAMAFKQVVMHRLSNFQVEVFSPGSERDLHDLGRPQKVSVDFSISSSDEKFLSSLAEAIFSCVIEDARNDYLGGTKGSSFQKRQLSCSIDSSVCIHRISEAEVVKNAKKCLESFNLAKSSNKVHKSKNGWWSAPNYESLAKLGGTEFVLWVNEYIPTYKLQINVKAFDNMILEGRHELENACWEVLLSHFQLAELGNVLDMYFEDQFTLPGKTFHPHWNSGPSKIKKNNGYLKNLYPLFAGSCIVLLVSIIAQLCWPRSLRDKRLSHASLSQSYCSDIHYLDESEIQDYCTWVVKTIKDSFGFSGDVMVDTNIGAWVGELPECFMDIGSKDNAASDDVHHPNDYSQETLRNIASFQVVMSEEDRVVGFQPTNRLAVNHWATNPLAKLLYNGRVLSPGFAVTRCCADAWTYAIAD
ncbi:hypothetical protein EJB05_25529, partial [Eragrostis curvula]